MGTRVRALACARNILNAASHSPLREKVGENPHERSARIRPARRITFARGEIKARALFALEHKRVTFVRSFVRSFETFTARSRTIDGSTSFDDATETG